MALTNDSSTTATTALTQLAQSEPLRLRIRGNSMLPTLRSGDFVELKAKCCYLPGDIVAFRHEDNRLLVHRIVGYRPYRSGFYFVAQGDAASHNDIPQRMSCIIGRVSNVPVTLMDRVRAGVDFARIVLNALRRRKAQLSKG